MRKLLNSLYVTTENAYLSLDGETVKVETANRPPMRVPISGIEDIYCFSYAGASPALVGKCVENNIGVNFFTPYGKYLYSASGFGVGNTYLRRIQYSLYEDIEIPQRIITAKIYNSAETLNKFCKNHSLQVDTTEIMEISKRLKQKSVEIKDTKDISSLRGLEGEAAQLYFSQINNLLLNNEFEFTGRSRRPPLDEINAMLSFGYTLLTSQYAAAISSVGLDVYGGFLHADKGGRKSLALDMMEELRSPFVDRFVLSLVNNRIIRKIHFTKRENGAVEFTDEGKKIFLTEWQNKKTEEITHPYTKEKLPWGLVPYLQAKLLAQYLRGDIDGYPPFFWR